MALASALERAAFFVGVLCCVWLAALLCSRLTGLLPDFFSLRSAAIPLILGLGCGLLFHRRPSLKDAARLADAKLDSKDLFLNALLIDEAFGDYAPLLAAKAEAEAENIKPPAFVKIPWLPPLRNIVLACAVLLPLSATLPQLDPFAKKAQERKREERKTELTKIDEAVKKRIESLKLDPKARNSEEVARTLEKLKAELAALKPDFKSGNAAKIKELRAGVDAVLKNRNEERLRDLLGRELSGQSFGKLGEKAERWREQLKNGDMSGVKSEMDALRELAAKIASMPDSAEKEKALQELNSRLKELAKFNRECLGSGAVQSALDTALKELGLSNGAGVDSETLKACENAMKLGGKEMDSLNAMLNDLKDLDSAAQTLQLAKLLNDLNGMKSCGSCSCGSLGAYAQAYAEMLRRSGCEGGDGIGPGAGTKGSGGFNGADSKEKSAIRNELSKSSIEKGRMLLDWKTKGVGQTGELRGEYLETVREVKGGVGEAIVKERVPPGYHDAVKNYFGTLPVAPPPAPEKDDAK
jgi:hypothetical protein